MLIADCCECTDDNFNVCLKCHNAGKTCLVTDEHKLRVRYIYDRMISFEELSPWVSRLVLPSEVREMA
jgi:hypothetical protein